MKQNKSMQTVLLSEQIEQEKEFELKDLIQQNKEQIVNLLKGLHLSRRHIDSIIERLNSHCSLSNLRIESSSSAWRAPAKKLAN